MVTLPLPYLHDLSLSFFQYGHPPFPSKTYGVTAPAPITSILPRVSNNPPVGWCSVVPFLGLPIGVWIIFFINLTSSIFPTFPYWPTGVYLPCSKSYPTLTKSYSTISGIINLLSSKVTLPLLLWLPYLNLTSVHVILPSLARVTLP
jgi:hypothetical protein